MFIIWKTDTPKALIASLIWNASEFFGMPLGKKTAPIIFELVMGYENKK